MNELRTHVGEGWLRATGTGSSTARYRLTVDAASGGGRERVAGHGTIESDLITIIEVERARQGVLVLESGRPMRVRLTRLEGYAAHFELV